jgi:hypothetical protein
MRWWAVVPAGWLDVVGPGSVGAGSGYPVVWPGRVRAAALLAGSGIPPPATLACPGVSEDGVRWLALPSVTVAGRGGVRQLVRRAGAPGGPGGAGCRAWSWSGQGQAWASASPAGRLTCWVSRPLPGGRPAPGPAGRPRWPRPGRRRARSERQDCEPRLIRAAAVGPRLVGYRHRG